jgi:hypothetical protein
VNSGQWSEISAGACGIELSKIETQAPGSEMLEAMNGEKENAPTLRQGFFLRTIGP